MKLSRTRQVGCCDIPPLKIRGARGVMKNYGNNPLYPPYFKAEGDGENPYFKGDVEADTSKRSSL